MAKPEAFTQELRSSILTNEHGNSLLLQWPENNSSQGSSNGHDEIVQTKSMNSTLALFAVMTFCLSTFIQLFIWGRLIESIKIDLDLKRVRRKDIFYGFAKGQKVGKLKNAFQGDEIWLNKRHLKGLILHQNASK